jgi:hypothetical protein
MIPRHVVQRGRYTAVLTRVFCAALTVALVGCGGQSTSSNASAPPAPAATPAPPGEGPYPLQPITVVPTFPQVAIDGATGSIPLNSSASYGWNVLIALNWPASTAPNTRGVADATKGFGTAGTPAWVTMRSKVELYPGNASATVPPHGVTLDASGKPNNGPDYGYGDPPQYAYAAPIPACPGQPPVTNPALIVLDETTQINNNQTYSGAAPATDPTGFNSKPQLIRYALKMSQPIFTRSVLGQYWYSGKGSPLAAAENNYIAALAKGTSPDPNPPYVNLAPADGDDPNQAGIEIKSAWRPLSPAEMTSGRFLTATVRYYEQPAPRGTSCYREAVWGLVGMHVISFSRSAPWVIWNTFEQADNILTADGRPTEDVDGNRIITGLGTPTTPALSSDPSQLAPTVTATGDYCVSPGSRLYFRENPFYGTLPSGGNICVNTRWSEPEPVFIGANKAAHQAIADYLQKQGQGSSPLMFYKLVGSQGVPVNAPDTGKFSTPTSYQSANAVIETDYSLGNFTGDLVNGVPSNVVSVGGKTVDYVNTTLFPFQSLRFNFTSMKMGGCAGCHGFAAQVGQGFSFALGNNVVAPERTEAFLLRSNPGRVYFPAR